MKNLILILGIACPMHGFGADLLCGDVFGEWSCSGAQGLHTTLRLEHLEGEMFSVTSLTPIQGREVHTFSGDAVPICNHHPDCARLLAVSKCTEEGIQIYRKIEGNTWGVVWTFEPVADGEMLFKVGAQNQDGEDLQTSPAYEYRCERRAETGKRERVWR